LYEDPERRVLWRERMERDGMVRGFEWELMRRRAAAHAHRYAYLVIDPKAKRDTTMEFLSTSRSASDSSTTSASSSPATR
jgi:hypothetical protein